MVRQSGIRVSRSRTILAGIADAWAVLLGGDPFAGDCAVGCAGDHKGNMPWLFFFSALSIRRFTRWGCWRGTASHFTTTEFWRFWVVHLWVEDFLELFTTIMVAYIFVLLGSRA